VFHGSLAIDADETQNRRCPVFLISFGHYLPMMTKPLRLLPGVVEMPLHGERASLEIAEDLRAASR